MAAKKTTRTKDRRSSPKLSTPDDLRERVRRKYFSLLRSAARSVARGTEPLAVATSDNLIVFRIRWDGDTAALDHLVYNGVFVTESPSYAPGEVSVTFRRPREAAHVFEWTLLFPAKKLQNLSATASIDGTGSTLATKASAETRWQGTASC